ncbi:hypothetical protein [Mycetocola sp. 2940]|uniref:TolB family protein n=1 Tax=Mycetocola sp. 2940 TaxID=3156452 RepID=UPI003397BD46
MATLLCASGCTLQTEADSPGSVETDADSTDTDLCSKAVTSPTVDPAARPIAFTSDRSGSFDLWLMGTDGSDVIQLTNSDEAEATPSWSPDGERLIFMSAVDLEISRADICVINADGTGLRNLTDTADVNEITPSWSPDGAQIVYGTLQGDAAQIHVMNSDGGERHLLTSDGTWPSWSPDGQRIVFSTSRGGSQESLWTVNRDGSGEALLADGESGLAEPAWSPDGKSIAYVATTGDPNASDPVEWNDDIFVMAADGGPGRRITRLPGNDHWPPAWSPDSAKLAITADGSENVGEILVIDLSTLATTNLTDSKANDMFPAWRQWPAVP